MRLNHALGRRFAGCAILALLVPFISASPGRADIAVFSKPVSLGGGSEPGIDIGSDGSIFVNSPSWPHSSLWRALPGKTFKQVTFQSPYNRFPGGGDSDVALSPGDPNRVYFLDLWVGSDSLAVSNDNGTTWSAGTPVTTLPGSDRQWISVGNRDPQTGLDTVFIMYHNFAGGLLEFARSTDGGQTWTYHSFLPGIPPVGAFPNPIAVDGDFLATNYVSNGYMTVATSNDSGTTWTPHRASLINNIPGSIQNLAIDGQDIWVVYVDLQYQVQVLHSPDRGLTWENSGYPTQVTDGTGSSIFPWIAARNGHVVLSWFEAPAGSGDPNYVDASWNLMYSEYAGRDTDGNITFSVPTVAASGVKSSGGVCTMGVGCQKDRELGDFQSIAIDQAGRAAIAFGTGSGAVEVVRQN